MSGVLRGVFDSKDTSTCWPPNVKGMLRLCLQLVFAARSANCGKVRSQPVQLARGNGSSAEIQNAPRLLGTKIIQRDLDVAPALIEPCSPECREDQLSELTPISRSTWPAVPPACLRYRYT